MDPATDSNRQNEIAAALHQFRGVAVPAEESLAGSLNETAAPPVFMGPGRDKKMKTKTQPTPGPWKVGTGWIMGPKNQAGAPICTIGVSAVNDANAALIAAAPDLLAALKTTEQSLSGLGWDSATYPGGTQPLLAAIRAAILKAEGGI